MQSLVTFLVNSFDFLVLLKDTAEVLTAPKDELTDARLESAASLVDWIGELCLTRMHWAPGCSVDRWIDEWSACHDPTKVSYFSYYKGKVP